MASIHTVSVWCLIHSGKLLDAEGGSTDDCYENATVSVCFPPKGVDVDGDVAHGSNPRSWRGLTQTPWSSVSWWWRWSDTGTQQQRGWQRALRLDTLTGRFRNRHTGDRDSRRNRQDLKRPCALVCSGRFSKKTGWLRKNRSLLLMVLEAGNTTIRFAIWREVSSWFTDVCLLAGSWHGRWWGSSPVSSYKRALIPSVRLHPQNLITP